MFTENLILALILLALGFAIFLLSNLQKGILTKLFGWFVALAVMFSGIFYAAKIIGPQMLSKAKNKVSSDVKNLKNSTKIKNNPIDNLYKKSNIDKMFNEIP